MTFYFELYAYYMYLIDIPAGGRQNSKMTPRPHNLYHSSSCVWAESVNMMTVSPMIRLHDMATVIGFSRCD